MSKPRYLHCVVSCAAMLASSSTWAAEGGMAGFLRGVTGALGGQQNLQQPAQPTATLGIRGMDNVDPAAQAAIDPGLGRNLQLLDQWAAIPADSEKAAKAKGLVPRTVAMGNGSQGGGQ